MKLRKSLSLVLMFSMGVMSIGNVLAYTGKLSPQDFNRMYYYASKGELYILRNAVNRGLNIDTVNVNGDTGLCIAVKRKDYVAYNTFRLSGANPKHPCTYRMLNEYRQFLGDKEHRVLLEANDKNSIYYQQTERVWWPWILGGLAIGGGIWALSSSGGGGGSGSAYVNIPQTNDSTALEKQDNYGLARSVSNYLSTVDGVTEIDTKDRKIVNRVGSINLSSVKLLPNILNNDASLFAYKRVINSGKYISLGDIYLQDATILAAVYGQDSVALNQGNINIQSKNGTLGLVSGDKGTVINDDSGVIEMVFTGAKEGATITGLYTDTNATAINYGTITGTTSYGRVESDDDFTGELIVGNGDSDFEEEDNGDVEIPASVNSGTVLGITLFDLFTGKDMSSQTVLGVNYGVIDLKAGFNGSADASVSLIGMGSYIDDNFLKGTKNPNFAEKMMLNNYGDISLSYKGAYQLSNGALKLGQGGLIGMRGDASSTVLNKGNIYIDLTETSMPQNVDVAAGLLSVHGAALINDEEGNIVIENEAVSGGVSYGMLAAPGEGAQTRLYKWQAPKLYNYGLIDIEASNSYAMASFAGGDIVNSGVINLGVENGHSYYTNNYGLYAAGADDTKMITIKNMGTINVYSTLSTAIYNAFSGSVDMSNDGYIYISNKATGSTIFGGNFSTVYNNGVIRYLVDNSDSHGNVRFGIEGADATSFNVTGNLAEAVVKVGNDEKQKQLFINNGTIVIGDKQQFLEGKDYGGTYSTAGVKVSKQGGAENRNLIQLTDYDSDIVSYNTGMWLDETTTAASYINNKNEITINATNSVGMRNDSNLGAVASNYGTINVNGSYSYGMAVTKESAFAFNGHNDGSSNYPVINVSGDGAVGGYVLNGRMYNYGLVYLTGNNTTAFLLDGKLSELLDKGEIDFDREAGLEDIVYYWLTNTATKKFEITGDIIGHTLAKMTYGGEGELDSRSVVNVIGDKSYLFYVEGDGSKGTILGTVNVRDGAMGSIVKNLGEISLLKNAQEGGELNVEGVDTVGIRSEGGKVVLTNHGRINVVDGIGIYADTDGENVSRVTIDAGMNVRNGIGIVETGRVSGKSTSVDIESGAYVAVNGSGAAGVEVEGSAILNNKGRILVGMSDKDVNDTYDIDNMEDISNYNYGVFVFDGVINNSGTIRGDGGKKGQIGIIMLDNSEVNNNGDGLISNMTYGIYAVKGKFKNSGEISGNDYGIHVGGGDISASNSGKIINNKVGVEIVPGYFSPTFTNEGTISSNTIGIDAHVGKVINSGGTISYNNTGVKIENAELNNRASIMYNDIGVNLISGQVKNDGSIQSNNVGVLVNSGTMANNAGGGIRYNNIGIKALNGEVSNQGEISNNNVGIYINGANVTNDGEIKAQETQNAVEIYSGSFINNGNISVVNGTGVYTRGGTAINSGTITVLGAGAGVYVSGGNFTNSGTIIYDSSKHGSCSNIGVGGICEDIAPQEEGEPPVSLAAFSNRAVYVANNASFVNKGVVDFNDETLDFDVLSNGSGTFVVGEGGTYKAATLSGHIVADKDVVKGSFEDIYNIKNAFVGVNNGLSVVSGSYMFDAKLKENEESNIDVELDRLEFEKLINNKEIANFFETNYKLQHNVKMYDVLKNAGDKAHFDNAVVSETGQKFYANLAREDMSVLRIIHDKQQNRILSDGLDNVTVGADYYRTGKDGLDNLSGYDTDIYSAYVGAGKKLSSNLSIGGALSASYVSSHYDEVNSERDNKVIMAFLPILYQKGQFSVLSEPSIGVGFTKYKRGAMSGKYEADAVDFYYGMYNHAEYDIDLKVAELALEAELNLQGANMGEAKEKAGLSLKANNMLSLEAGVGVKLRKQIQLMKNRLLMLSLGTKYYVELLDPYKKFNVSMNGSPVGFTLNGYNEDKKRLKTTAEAIYKDGDFSLSAEVSHLLEKESNIEGGVGVRYNF